MFLSDIQVKNDICFIEKNYKNCILGQLFKQNIF